VKKAKNKYFPGKATEMRQTEKTEEIFIQEKIAELRMKLLDLSNRNTLLNFRHSERALTHIRIIDELPDFLFGAFLNNQELTFKPLPEPDDEPHDEKTEDFQITFREATLTDEQYLEEIEALIDEDDSFDDLAVIERNLKNRVRESLGIVGMDFIRQTPLLDGMIHPIYASTDTVSIQARRPGRELCTECGVGL